MARWKSRVEFLLSVGLIELLFLPVTVEALQGKMCQNSMPSGHLEPRFQGEGVVSREYFWFLQNWTHFAIRQCKLHRATWRRFDTIPACDRQTDRRTDRRNSRS